MGCHDFKAHNENWETITASLIHICPVQQTSCQNALIKLKGKIQGLDTRFRTEVAKIGIRKSGGARGRRLREEHEGPVLASRVQADSPNSKTRKRKTRESGVRRPPEGVPSMRGSLVKTSQTRRCAVKDFCQIPDWNHSISIWRISGLRHLHSCNEIVDGCYLGIPLKTGDSRHAT